MSLFVDMFVVFGIKGRVIKFPILVWFESKPKIRFVLFSYLKPGCRFIKQSLDCNLLKRYCQHKTIDGCTVRMNCERYLRVHFLVKPSAKRS